MGFRVENDNVINDIDAVVTFGELEFLESEPVLVFDEAENRYTDEVLELDILVYSSKIGDNTTITIPADFDVSKFEYNDPIELAGHVTATSWLFRYKANDRNGKEVERSEQAFKVRAAGITKVSATSKPESTENKPEKPKNQKPENGAK